MDDGTMSTELRVAVLRRVGQALRRAAAREADELVAAEIEALADECFEETFGDGLISPADDAFLLEHFGQLPPDPNEAA